jgi:methylated-DNA-[protein]-cysteine S-methyltransferase
MSYGCRARTEGEGVGLDSCLDRGFASDLRHQEYNVPQLSLHTPVGDITVFDEDGAIVSLDWGWVANQSPSPVLERAREQLQAYFDGELTKFNLPLAAAGTAYRQGVWQALCEIPYGETRSYLDIARKAGGSARSVGQANGRNPIPLIIPCHRVVAATHIGGYSGGDGLLTKRWLLVLENRDRVLL